MHTLSDFTRTDEESAVVVQTTLYDLMDAIQDDAQSFDDDLVVAYVVHLLRSGRIRFCDRTARGDTLSRRSQWAFYS